MIVSAIEDAVGAIARGEVAIVYEQVDGETVGLLVAAGDAIEPETLTFMMRRARGLTCVSMPDRRLDELDMPLIETEDPDSFEATLTVSMDLIEGIATGGTLEERVNTIRALAHPGSKAGDFLRPGHIFAVRSHVHGVLGNPGRAEVAVDLARLAGRSNCGVFCEFANDDGSHASLSQLEEFSRNHGLHAISTEALRDHIRANEIVVHQVSSSRMPTRFGDFQATTFVCRLTGVEHIALTCGDLQGRERVPVRVHSECLTGESFASLRCDCGEQLERALELFQQSGLGCLIYMRGHEGRGIGIGNKIAAYELQDGGYDTLDANLELGFPGDDRDYMAAVSILKLLGISSVSLLTNNPSKVDALRAGKIDVVERRSLIVSAQAHSASYLRAKRERFGHFLHES